MKQTGGSLLRVNAISQLIQESMVTKHGNKMSFILEDDEILERFDLFTCKLQKSLSILWNINNKGNFFPLWDFDL